MSDVGLAVVFIAFLSQGVIHIQTPWGKAGRVLGRAREVVVETGAGVGICRRRRWGQCSNGPGENSKEKGREEISRENQRVFRRDYSSRAQAWLCFRGMHIETREQDKTTGLIGPLVPSECVASSPNSSWYCRSGTRQGGGDRIKLVQASPGDRNTIQITAAAFC